MTSAINVSQIWPDARLGRERLSNRVALLSGIFTFCCFFASPSIDIGAYEVQSLTVGPTVASVVRDEGGVLARPDLLNRLAVTFDQNVNVDREDLSIHNDTLQSMVDTSSVSFSYDATTLTATWNFSNLVLDASFYTFELSDSITSVAGGVALDGDSDGIAGGGYAEKVYVAIPGDVNLDGQVDVLGDALVLISNLNIATNIAWVDGNLNGDQQVDVLYDAFILLSNFGRNLVVASKPPIIMIVLDDLFDYQRSRFRFGVHLQTPNLDRLAARGTTFGNAFCSIAVCNASRSSALSGLSPLKTQIHQAEPTQFFDTLTTEDTLMSRMQLAGYQVLGTGKVLHTSARLSDRPAMERIHDDFFQASGRLKLPAGRIASVQAEGELSADDKHVAWAADKLRNWDGEGEPLFLSVGIIRPHAPFIVPQEYFDLYDRASIQVPALAEEDLSDVSIFYKLFRLALGYNNYLVSNDLDEEFIHGYLASTTYADAKVGEILDAIDANPALADARIILWSDNGYELGDKLTWNKFTLWESSAKVPLLVVDPSLPTDTTIDHNVSLLDVAPTVLEWAGQPIPEEFDGVSLLQTAENRSHQDHRAVLTTMLGSCSIRQRDMRLNLYPDGSVELYDMRIDPSQQTNLAALTQWQPVVESMKIAIVEEIKRQGGIMDPDAIELTGTSGDDVLFLVGEQMASGGQGNDTYFVADGFANEASNEGEDLVFFANTHYSVPENVETVSTYPFLNSFSGVPVWNVAGNDQENTILVFAAQGEVHAEGGSDVIFSRGARDRLYGDGGRDEIHAGGNDDILNGGQGADQLFGDAGDDDLEGGTGSDQLTGGLGNDRFRFPEDTIRDVVTDFTFGDDTIWLHSLTNLNSLNAQQITNYLIAIDDDVLIRDDSNRKMLIQNATIDQVRSSFEHE